METNLENKTAVTIINISISENSLAIFLPISDIEPQIRPKFGSDCAEREGKTAVFML